MPICFPVQHLELMLEPQHKIVPSHNAALKRMKLEPNGYQNTFYISHFFIHSLSLYFLFIFSLHFSHTPLIFIQNVQHVNCTCTKILNSFIQIVTFISQKWCVEDTFKLILVYSQKLIHFFLGENVIHLWILHNNVLFCLKK